MLTDIVRKVDDMVLMFRSLVLAEPTSAHRVLKALHEAGHMVGPVATHNFDRLFARAGLEEAFMRRYDQRTPHYGAPHARHHTHPHCRRRRRTAAVAGAEAFCVKCGHNTVFTFFGPQLTASRRKEWNGLLERRGPLPKRLERQRQCCEFRWDEALAGDLLPGMTVEALAYAIDNATPYPVDLHREVCTYMAEQPLRVSARPDHLLWQCSDGRPTTSAKPQETEDTNPAQEPK